MPKYQFFYCGEMSTHFSDPKASNEESLDEAIKCAESFVQEGTEEIVIMELDRALSPKKVVARVSRAGQWMYPTETKVY